MAAASPRNRSFSVAPLVGSRAAQISQTRSLASDALVEIKPGEIGIVSGIPEEHLKRRVIIYSPAQSASQQGAGKVGKWKINFMSTQKWENPLMGWTSTGDPYANVGDAGLDFDSEEAAKAFAEKHGWEYLTHYTGCTFRQYGSLLSVAFLWVCPSAPLVFHSDSVLWIHMAPG